MFPIPPPLPWWLKAVVFPFIPLLWISEWRDRRHWEKLKREKAANEPPPKPVPTVGAGWFIIPVPWWLRFLFWRPWK